LLFDEEPRSGLGIGSRAQADPPQQPEPRDTRPPSANQAPPLGRIRRKPARLQRGRKINSRSERGSPRGAQRGLSLREAPPPPVATNRRSVLHPVFARRTRQSVLRSPSSNSQLFAAASSLS